MRCVLCDVGGLCSQPMYMTALMPDSNHALPCPPCLPLQLPIPSRDTRWSSYTLRLGFPVMGIWPDYSNGTGSTTDLTSPRSPIICTSSITYSYDSVIALLLDMYMYGTSPWDWWKSSCIKMTPTNCLSQRLGCCMLMR